MSLGVPRRIAERALGVSFVFLFVFSSPAPALGASYTFDNSSRAEIDQCHNEGGNISSGQGNGVAVCNGVSDAVANQHGNIDPATTQAAQTQATGNSEALENAARGVTNAGLSVVLSPFAVISYAIFKLASFLLGLAGIIFNWVMLVVVFEFAKYLGNSPGMLLAWHILRDFGNIALIFGFVFMGVSTILDLHHYSWQKSLPQLVVFALLLNFSLFAAEAVVDTSNVLSSTLYKNSYAQTNACVNVPWEECAVSNGIAGEILSKLSITSVYQTQAPSGGDNFFSDVGQYLTNPIATILQFIGLALVVTTAAVVLLAGAFMLISRGIVLAFLMVVSPIGFAGMAVPPLHGIANEWWQQLLKQAFFAPAFLLLLLVSLKMTDGLQQIAQSNGSLANALSSATVGDTGPIIIFILIIGFMIGAMMMASRFGIAGADAVTHQAQAIIGGTAGLMTAGVGGWYARRTIGSASNAAARALRLSPIGRTPILGAALTGIADRGATSSFDLRGKGGQLGGPSEAAQKGRRGELQAIVERNKKHKESLDADDKLKYDLAKVERDRLKEPLDELKEERRRVGLSAATALGTDAALNRAFNTADRRVQEKTAQVGTRIQHQEDIMKETTEGKRNQEDEEKEKLDHKISEWSEAAQNLKEATQNLDRIARARPTATPAQLLQLDIEERKYKTQESDALATQVRLEPEMRDLRDSINALRKTIKQEESQYRRNVQGLAASTSALGPLSPFDTRALREATLSLKGLEKSFKPKNINDSFKGLLRKELKRKGYI